MGGDLIMKELPDKQFKYLFKHFIDAEKRFLPDLGNLLYKICNFVAGIDTSSARKIRNEISDSEYRLVARARFFCNFLEDVRVKCEKLEYYEACSNIANTITIIQAGVHLYRECNYL